MNPIIEKLLGQSGLQPYYDAQEEHIEKFAELIIEECKQAVRETYVPVLEDEEMMKDDYWKGYVSSGCDAVCEIGIRFEEDYYE